MPRPNQKHLHRPQHLKLPRRRWIQRFPQYRRRVLKVLVWVSPSCPVIQHFRELKTIVCVILPYLRSFAAYYPLNSSCLFP